MFSSTFLADGNKVTGMLPCIFTMQRSLIKYLMEFSMLEIFFFFWLIEKGLSIQDIYKSVTYACEFSNTRKLWKEIPLKSNTNNQWSKILKNKLLNTLIGYFWSSKFFAFLSLQIHHCRQIRTIFHTFAILRLPLMMPCQEARRLITLFDIIQANSTQEKSHSIGLKKSHLSNR